MKKIAFIILLVVAVLFILTPVYLMVKISFSPPSDLLKEHPVLGIHGVTLDHWKTILSAGQIWAPLVKSLAVALMSVIFTLLIAVPGAYALARLPYKLTSAVLLFIFLSRMVPEIEIALPISISFIKIGLLDTNFGLMLAHSLRILPIVTWILVSSFKTIPKELEDAAFVDGCSKIRSLLSIIIPLALPGIAVAAIFGFLGSWDEFTYAVYLAITKKTLPLMVYYYINRASFFLASSYATIITIPVIIVTYALQKYLKAEYLAGAVKG
ncbi:MAG: carbohydrate ABC transporter permease [Candidatus Margulisiibacteriota bacterium]|nr:carbohydrate ABC transporter permease [Candidatus Margulisiibacteriota bacterium]